MLIKILPIYKECEISQAMVIAYPVEDVKKSLSEYNKTNSLDEFKKLSEDNLETNVINLYKVYKYNYRIIDLMSGIVFYKVEDIYKLVNAISESTDKEIIRIIKRYNMEQKLGGK